MGKLRGVIDNYQYNHLLENPYFPTVHWVLCCANHFLYHQSDYQSP